MVSERTGGSRLLVLTNRLGAAAFALALAGGIYHALSSEGRLPSLSRDFAPAINRLLEAGEHVEALRQMRFAADLAWDEETVRKSILPGMLRIAHDLGDHASEEYAARRLLRLTPDDATRRTDLAVAILEQDPDDLGRVSEAVHHAEVALRSDPTSVVARDIVATFTSTSAAPDRAHE